MFSDEGMVRDIDQLGAQGGREAMETIRQVNTGGPLRSLSFFHREFLLFGC